MTAQDVLEVARSYLGYTEKSTNSNLDDPTANAGHNNFTKFARDLDALADFYNGAKQGFAWCDVFVDACVYYASGKNEKETLYVLCQPYRSAGAGCLYSAQYYKQAGRWSDKPQVGAQIFFSYAPGEVSHTGLVECVGMGEITTIEGNSSDRVERRTYSINDSRIYGYGLPRYDEDHDDLCPSPSYENYTYKVKTNLLVKGNRGPQVLNMQYLLAAQGFYNGDYSGIFDEETEKALKVAQRAYGIYVDGEWGGESFSAAWNYA